MKKTHKPLKELRLANHFTQKQVADSLGWVVSTYANYETGFRNLNRKAAKQLSEFYGVSIDYLYGDISPNKEYVLSLIAHLDDEKVKNVIEYIEFISQKEAKV